MTDLELLKGVFNDGQSFAKSYSDEPPLVTNKAVCVWRRAAGWRERACVEGRRSAGGGGYLVLVR